MVPFQDALRAVTWVSDCDQTASHSELTRCPLGRSNSTVHAVIEAGPGLAIR
jgi:hypothetical protein